jgi:DNA-binding XRE family transcriptional regulator
MNTPNPFEQFRIKHRLSQAELGRALGVGQNAISNYESGVRKPNLEVAWQFKRYAESLGDEISLEEIYPEPAAEEAAA